MSLKCEEVIALFGKGYIFLDYLKLARLSIIQAAQRENQGKFY